ncbi:PQ loop repeat-domain-containing protein [Tricladium varicosporioides]|nr:PQ loop repeat-domain-containing protein [Hymenoscyphus varicosporioides]
MVPPTQQLNLDITAISGICGSISIACWVVVFSPQIIEQFRRGSADGLSLQFIIVWLLGDVFNILGAILQGVLPTMLILAVYYTLADIVLLLQCFYYRGFTWHDEVIPPPKPTTTQPSLGEADERTGLLSQPANPSYNPFSERSERERRPSFFSETSVHLNPVVPLVEPRKPNADASAIKDQKPTTVLQATLFNLFAILLVCAAGVFGWYISERSASSPHTQKPTKGEEHLSFSLWGQIFGYICAVLYLGSRIPQLILNFRRKSTSGVSVLFFLFACIGNLTYVLSIFAYESPCVRKKHGCRNGVAAREYWRYIAVNASWLAGSLGTLCLDLGIFAQFFHYRERDADEDDSAIDDESHVENRRVAERPLLDRENTGL